MEREKITGEVKISLTKLTEIQKEVKNISTFGKKTEQLLTASVTELLMTILAGAISLDASDIHIEPEEKKAKLRIRIDGILHDIIIFDLKVYKALLSRIKLLSGLKLNVTNRPQDGRFTILMAETTIEIRASTLPAEYGETIVLRILNPKNLIEIEALGLRKDIAEIFNKEIKRPNGMIIVTGPTGSGKTTTLYAILKKINKPEIKIITIEDPVEYHLEGLSQTQVDPSKGYTFANGLRSIMRQDPDVVLVGEIRDKETAEIALQAALTGHLVFSTLHTNDAAGAVARLIDLGVRPVSIAPAINMIVAQRLPRKVCKKCVEFIFPSPTELKKLKESLKRVRKEILPPSFLNPKLKIPKTKGCPDCNFTGYRGRIGIYETFLVDDEMERFILTSPSIVDMRELAIKKGMVLMYQDGLIKVLEGITTIEEVERVAQI
ncbi:MAG: GspE/PulE family protein [Patescibacteria group bacterium]|nr:GspE/PulE family protein [Patescibacteria group bacterium]